MIKILSYLLAMSIITTPLSAMSGTVSYYGLEECTHNPDPTCPTASGKSLYKLERDKVEYCASRYYPIGTKLQVTSTDGKKATCTVLDRGPAKGLHRALDLNKRTFAKLAKPHLGLFKAKKIYPVTNEKHTK